MAIGSPQWMYASGEAYTVDQSLKFNDDDTAYLSRTPSSAGNRNTWTFSFWLKLGTNDGGNSFLHSADDSLILTTSTGKISFSCADGTTRWPNVLRDSSAWYHILFAFDSTQSTASNRAKLYINGTQITAETTVWPSLNRNTTINNASAPIYIASNATPGGSLLDGYLAEVHFIDGQALTPSSFGETGDYGEFKPIEYSGTYGTNGFYLPFKQDYTVEGFSTVTYSGQSGDQYIGGVGFQPDLVWIKQRNGDGDHVITDSVRGVTKDVHANENHAETTTAEGLQAFNTDGFTLGDNDGNYNRTGRNMVAWNWDMGGSNASNSNGSITSTVRANPTYGQSIVSYTGTGANASVGHGLSSTPEMMLVKNRTNAAQWTVLHKDLASDYETDLISLNNTAAAYDDIRIWNDTEPTASLFYLGIENDVNKLNSTFIAYCFHSVTGYSKFGSYTGNGSSTGPSVTLGFAPAFLLIKSATQAEPWSLIDNMRTHATTGLENVLTANTSAAETQYSVDLNSNGFQIKDTTGVLNANSQTYIYMAFADKREYAYWLDQSGNNNDWTSNNLTESDISVDTPTNNFATWNPLGNSENKATLSEGNLKAAYSGTGSDYLGTTLVPISGKWYVEFTIGDPSGASSDRTSFGLADLEQLDADGYADGTSDHKLLITSSSYNRVYNHGTEQDGTYTARSDGDIVQFAWDLDTGKQWIGLNNTWFVSGDPAAGSNPIATQATKTFMIVSRLSAGSSATQTHIINCGQDSSFAGTKTAQGNSDSNDIGDFYYEPPTGFLALCTSNLPDVDIVPSENFNTILWSGNSSSNTVTGMGFDAGLWWSKVRNVADAHILIDEVRGDNEVLRSNTNGSEYGNGVGFTSNSDGFSMTTTSGEMNHSGRTYVTWGWKGSGGSGSSNTDGSVTTTVSANPDAGFSIVSYTGTGASATFGHGLSKAPEISFYKIRSQSYRWMVYTGNTVSTTTLVLDDTDAGFNSGGTWGTHGASTFALLANADVNGNNQTYVSYHFHSVDGYSKVGSYEGNGNADGTFVYTGFRPALVITKPIDATGNWNINDSVRSPDNVVDERLKPNSSDAESDSDALDFTSNGFKIRTSGTSYNQSAYTYIYLAFAEIPFKYVNAR